VQDPGPISPREEKTIGINGPSPRTVSVPVGIDPGFEYRPGARSMAMLRQVGTATDPEIAAAYAEAIAPIVARVIQRDFDTWVNRVLGKRQASGDVATVALLLPPELDALRRRNQSPARTDISLSAAMLASDALTEAEWRTLPTLLAGRRAAVYDKRNQAVLLITDAPGDDADIKIAVRADFNATGATLSGPDAAVKISATVLRDTSQYELIWGEL